MKEAAKMLNEPPVSGRTLEATEDPEGEDARRAGGRLEALEARCVQQIWVMKSADKSEGGF